MTNNLIQEISNSEIIEDYPDDYPCPSSLLLLFIDQTAWHLVVANCEEQISLVTAYQPDPSKWDNWRDRNSE